MKIKSYKRFLTTLLIFGIVVYLIVLGIMRFLQESKTYKAIYDELDVEKAAKAIVLRQENLVVSGVSANIEWFVKEGDRVKKTQRLAEAVILSNTSSKELLSPDVNDRLKSNDILKIDLTKVDQELEALRKEVYAASSQNNYKRMKELQREVSLKMNRRKKLVDSQNMLDDSVSSFKRSVFSATDLQVGKKLDLNSTDAGIVTYQTDGFEETLTLDNIYNLDYDLIFASQGSPGVWGKASISPSMPMIKIVDTENWYMICQVDIGDLDAYEKNKEIAVKIDEQSYTGTIFDAFENNQKGIVVVKMIDAYEKFHTVRFVDVRVVLGNYRGIKIQKSSIITYNGIQGVYVAGAEHKAIFRPVKILGYNEDYAVVKPGYITLIQNETSSRIKTVDEKSEVVINPQGMSPGDAID